MSRAERVTVSLPAELLARIEHRRGWRQAEAEEREERDRSAYQAQPETDAERTWADEAAEGLFGEDDTGWSTDQAGGATS